MREPKPADLTFNIEGGEVLQPQATIELQASRPIDARSAQGAIRLSRGCTRVDVAVELRGRGRVAAVRAEELAPGAYVLTVAELLDSKGGRLAGLVEVPFTVAPVAGELPKDHRIEHAVRLEVGELGVTRLSPGEHSDAALHALLHQRRGERVDAGELLAGVQQRRAKRFGKLHETLWERLERAGDRERIDVVVWPRFVVEAAPYEKPNDRRLDAPPKEELAVAREHERSRRALVASLGRMDVKLPSQRETRDDGVPAVHVTATPDQIRKLARSSTVGAVFLDDRTAITDLGDSIAVAHSDSAHNAGFDGTVAAGERPRPPDLGGRQEHGGQSAPWARARL